jgi:hypothetical protein
MKSTSPLTKVVMTCVVFGVCVILGPSVVVKAERATASTTSSVGKAWLQESYGKLPLSFEANQGQTDRQVRFLSRGPGYTLFLTPREAVVALRGRETVNRSSSTSPRPTEGEGQGEGAILRMQFEGANSAIKMTGLAKLPGIVNYFVGKDPKQWRTNIPTFAKVKQPQVYPGIDLVYYGNQRQLEFDFIVAPGADPKAIRLKVEGADRLEVDAHGDLLLHVNKGHIQLQRPRVYQEADGVRTELAGHYVLTQANEVSFQMAAHDASRPLVIDPTLVYSTYLGGSASEQGNAIAVDAAGNAFVTGSTQSLNFPTTAGSFQTTLGGSADVFVTKLNPTGTALVFSTYLGGSGDESGLGVAVDAAGNAYVTGLTSSANFPTTAGAFDSSFNGGSADAFVAKLNPTGTALVYSTYLGGGSYDGGIGIAVDAAGSAYVTGFTGSANFPTTAGAFQPASGGCGHADYCDAFVAKLNTAGSGLLYSTYLGGTGAEQGIGIAVDAAGNAYVTGQTYSTNFPTTALAFDTTVNGFDDAFVAKLNPTGSGLLYSTYLGGGGSCGFDEFGFDIAVDAAGAAYVTGETNSTNFPTTAGAFQPSPGGGPFGCFVDAFLTKLDPTGSGLLYSTYLGGGGEEAGFGVTVDAAGNAYVTGFTNSANFPVTSGAFQPAYSGSSDGFVAKLNPSLVGAASLVYSTYLGGSGTDAGRGIAVDSLAHAYVTGYTNSANFPVTPGAFQSGLAGGQFDDAFVAKITGVGAPAMLTLAPSAATNPVGTQHCVTATVEDVAGNPVSGVTVHFTVTGSVNTSGSDVTDANGQATFCYMGPLLPGPDAITAFADTNNNGTQDVGEPTGAATKTWVLPVTTPLCQITITEGGRITAANGDKATFGGNAQSSATGQTKGQQEYQDHGPVQGMNVKSINVQAIVCEDTTQASIYGQATINRAGSFFYRINVKDLADPGVGEDTYWILLQNGYNSSEKTLEGGNIQIRRK